MRSDNSEYDSNALDFVENNSVNGDESNHLQYNNTESSEFGIHHDTYDWLECESTSFPGKLYYFNLRTLCTTWTRPVPRHVKLQRFQRKYRTFYNNFTCNLHDPPIVVSSESEGNECTSSEDIKKKQDNKRKCEISETLTHLYYGASTQNFSDNNESDYSDSSIRSFACDPYNDENSCFIFSDCPSHELGEHFLMNNAPNEIQMVEEDTNENLESPAAAADFLEIEVCTPENTGKSEQPLSEDSTSIAERPINYSTSSSDENEIDQTYTFVPRLPKIKTKYLLKGQPTKKRKRKRLKKRTPVVKRNLKPTMIVCEMYGTKTVNYDPIEIELPPGVKQSNLSDSSVISSLGRGETAKSVVWNRLEFPSINSHKSNLSSESSLSSCSDCTCSISSDTSKSTSSTNNTSERNHVNKDNTK